MINSNQIPIRSCAYLVRPYLEVNRHDKA